MAWRECSRRCRRGGSRLRSHAMAKRDAAGAQALAQMPKQRPSCSEARAFSDVGEVQLRVKKQPLSHRKTLAQEIRMRGDALHLVEMPDEVKARQASRVGDVVQRDGLLVVAPDKVRRKQDASQQLAAR